MQILETQEFYASRLSHLKSRLDYFQHRENIWAFARLFAFVGLIVLIFVGFGVSEFIGILFILPSIAVFGIVINHHLRMSKEKLRYQYLLEINQAEMNCIQGDYASFANGNEYFEKEHPYLNDLDILGAHSLFQYINRTNTQPGAAKLADWLKRPAKFPDIKPRQDAIVELSEQINWRQDLRSVFYMNPSSAQNPDKLLAWCYAAPEILMPSFVKASLWGLPLIIIVLMVLSWFGMPGVFLSMAFLASFGINNAFIKKINKIQLNLSKSFEMLASYADIIKLIEHSALHTEKLVDLKSKFDGKNPASGSLKKLSQLLRNLDYRLNILVGLPLNLIFLWDIHQCMKLEKWKADNRDNIKEWFEAMAEFEALSSLANLKFNNPGWTFPMVTDDYFHISMKEAGHPLILPKNRILNDFTLDEDGKIALITGSNMSGKSTFLRTCGVNIILAMAGAPVCSKKIEISYVKIYSSMRIADSLEENTSSFYAELKKLAQIIQVVEQKEKVFLLLDEILRGTNSNDRHTGSVALIKQLIKNGAPAILATHDLALSSLTEEAGRCIEIYNFDVKIQGDELYFDYKINPGICKSLNASILMKKMGIEV